VRIGFNELDPRILPDMGVKVTFLREADAAQTQASARPVMLVPKNAIKTENDTTYVFVVAGGVVDRRAVTVGGTDGDRLEVIAGLNSGERVIVGPPASIAAGVQVVSK